MGITIEQLRKGGEPVSGPPLYPDPDNGGDWKTAAIIVGIVIAFLVLVRLLA